MNLTAPITWGAPDHDERMLVPSIDPSDRDAVAILKAVGTLSKREKALILVLIQTISAWGGLEDATRAA